MRSYAKYLSFIPVLALALTLLVGCTPKENNPVTEPDPAAASTSVPDPATPAAPTPVASGTVNAYSAGMDDNGFYTGITALDYIEMFPYEALTVPRDVQQVTEEDVQTEIDSLLAEYGGARITDRAVKDGDTVNIDYDGSVAGIPFNGGSTNGNGTNVTIGVTQYIDDFLQQLIGHMPGETVNVEVTFPDAYQEASLQGKDALFVTTIHYIVSADPPELTDAFVEANYSDAKDWKTVEQMREGVKTELQTKAIQQYIGDYMTSTVTIRSLPEQLTTHQDQSMLQYYRDYATYVGMSFEDFLTNYLRVADENELIETNREINEKNAKYALVTQAVAEAAGISVSEDDMTKFFSDDYSNLVEPYGLPYLKQIILHQKVLDYISEHAVVE